MNIYDLLFPAALVKEMIYWQKADKKKLPGKEFYRYGKQLAKRLIKSGRPTLKLVMNPVSIVRFFEYDYVLKNMPLPEGKDVSILDISSPYLYAFYLSENYDVNYRYINPDKKDLANVERLAAGLKVKGELSFNDYNALNLPYPDEHFDYIVLISVIEHISDNGDSQAMKEIVRCLKPGGKAILTFPAGKTYREDYREKDAYNLGTEEKEGKYFFQRIYDKKAMDERLLKPVEGIVKEDVKIFGETGGDFYKEYLERWQKTGYWETVKDHYYISKYFDYINSFGQLPGIGVAGLTIRKEK